MICLRPHFIQRIVVEKVKAPCPCSCVQNTNNICTYWLEHLGHIICCFYTGNIFALILFFHPDTQFLFLFLSSYEYSALLSDLAHTSPLFNALIAPNPLSGTLSNKLTAFTISSTFVDSNLSSSRLNLPDFLKNNTTHPVRQPTPPIDFF